MPLRDAWEAPMIRSLLAVVGALALIASPASAQTVKTKSGDVAGVTKEGVASWKGIPFAAPPVGDLRWKAPQPVNAWTGVKQAKEIGPACLQPDRGDGGGVGAAPGQRVGWL